MQDGRQEAEAEGSCSDYQVVSGEVRGLRAGHLLSSPLLSSPSSTDLCQCTGWGCAVPSKTPAVQIIHNNLQITSKINKKGAFYYEAQCEGCQHLFNNHFGFNKLKTISLMRSGKLSYSQSDVFLISSILSIMCAMIMFCFISISAMSDRF